MDFREPSYFSQQVSEAARFHFPPRKDSSFQIESGGREECSESYDVERVNFPKYVVEFISRGTGHIRLGRESWQLPPGSLYVYNRDIPHRLSNLSSGGMTKYFLILRGSSVRRRLSDHGLAPGRVIQVRDQPRIAGIFDDLVRIGCGTQRNRREICLATLTYLLIKIEDSTLSNERIMSGAYSAYLKCARFIQNHFLDFASMNEVALACHLDPAYICRLFGRFSEQSPSHYLQQLRMDYAAGQLRQHGKSARAVSDQLGFSEPAAFSRAYKRTFGVSPSDSRLQNP